MKIEKTVVHAAQVDAQRPSISLDARLSEAVMDWIPEDAAAAAFMNAPSVRGLQRHRCRQLQFVEPRVRAALGEKFLVRAGLGDRSSSSTIILSARRIVESRCAITNAVRPIIKFDNARCTNISDSESSSEVASSRIRMGEFFSIARAMAMRCLCPPLKRCPRSPSVV